MAYHGARHSHWSLCQPYATTPLCPQGIFVQLVKANSPAALVGLRFGDQVLQIDGKNCAGWSSDKAQRALKKANPEKIVMVVRDRPFQRTVTVHKDSTGHVGIVVKKGKIVSLAKDSSAARNGLLTHHCICEVNGQNVIGMKDKQLMEVLAGAGNVVTLTIIPTVIYEHMVKRLSSGLVKSSMDHSIPDL
uniref:Syndecan binding protein 2 n=1 Tax=Zonotrichia albicollis TaxID=44394 RepID=A0A8D2M7V4_ZONAL